MNNNKALIVTGRHSSKANGSLEDVKKSLELSNIDYIVFDEIEEENDEGIIEVYYSPKSTPIKKFIGELLSCYWCTGVWVSTGLIIGYIYFSTLFMPIILIFAIAGLASILESLLQFWIE